MLLALAWLAWPIRVSAHARIVTTYPGNGDLLAAPPTTIHLWFSEPAQAVAEGISVIGPDGREVTRGRIHDAGLELWRSVDATARGTYVVLWQVISLDTHPSRGRFIFSVTRTSTTPWESAVVSSDIGAVSPAGLVLQVLSRWMHFAGYALSFGPIGFWLLILRRAPIEIGATAERRLWRLVYMGMLLLLLAEPLALLAQTASLSTSTLYDPTIAGDAMASSFGRVMAQQLSAAIALWVLIGAFRQGAHAALPLMLVLATGLALVDGQAAHAISTTPVWLALAVNTVHIAAMGLWLGGLASLLAIWNTPGLHEYHALVLRRFARVAACCLATLALSGTLMAWQHLAHLAELVNAGYGRTLSAKLIIVIVVILLASTGNRAHGIQRVRWWRIEAVTLLLVLGIAALLLSLPPSR